MCCVGSYCLGTAKDKARTFDRFGRLKDKNYARYPLSGRTPGNTCEMSFPGKKILNIFSYFELSEMIHFYVIPASRDLGVLSKDLGFHCLLVVFLLWVG